MVGVVRCFGRLLLVVATGRAAAAAGKAETPHRGSRQHPLPTGRAAKAVATGPATAAAW